MVRTNGRYYVATCSVINGDFLIFGSCFLVFLLLSTALSGNIRSKSANETIIILYFAVRTEFLYMSLTRRLELDNQYLGASLSVCHVLSALKPGSSL